MPTWAWAIVGLCLADLARRGGYMLARRRGWRLGQWGRLLTLRRPVAACFRCGTDYRIAPGKRTPYKTSGGTAREVHALCVRCWLQLPPSGRLGYYGLLLLEWQRTGLYAHQGGEAEWDEDRVAVYAAVQAGL